MPSDRTSTVTPCAYPEWACTEEGDEAWVRADLLDRSDDLLRDLTDSGWCEFAFTGLVPMWLDLRNGEWSDWLIRPVDPDYDPVEAVVYGHFEMTP